MSKLKLIIVAILLVVPALAAAEVPGTATWYLHVDFEAMRSEEAGKAIYGWMEDEVFDEVISESGVDLGKELDRLTAYSLEGQGPLFLFEGDISEESKDRVMTFIALEGDLQPRKSSGKSYYRLAGSDEDDVDNRPSIDGGNIEIQIEALEEESWISLDLKNKVILASSEQQMQDMLKRDGKIAGGGSHNGALVVLTAEKTLLQAGLNSTALGEEDSGDSGWNSNILRNTEQVAFLVAAAANKLAIEAKLITTEPDMARSLASVARGLISLVAFDDDMDDETVAVLQGTKVEAKGNALSISLAIDPGLVVSTLSD